MTDLFPPPATCGALPASCAALAAPAGLDPSGWCAAIVWRRKDRARARLVWRLDGPAGTVALKQGLRPVDGGAIGSEIAALDAATARFPGGFPGARAVDPAWQAMLVDRVAGVTLRDTLAPPGADQAAALARAAAGRPTAASACARPFC